MLNLSKKEHLESIITPLQKNGYLFSIKDKKTFNDSYISMIVSDNKDYLEIKLKRKWSFIFGHYYIRLLSSNNNLIEQLEKANQIAESKTSFLNIEKKKFHHRINSAIIKLRQEQTTILSSIGGKDKLNQQIDNLKSNPVYEDKLSVFNFIKPAIGIEIDDNGMHPAIGIALGGDRSGGLLIFDPLEGEIELGGYIGFGNLGFYDSVEFDIGDSIANLFD